MGENVQRWKQKKGDGECAVLQAIAFSFLPNILSSSISHSGSYLIRVTPHESYTCYVFFISLDGLKNTSYTILPHTYVKKVYANYSIYTQKVSVQSIMITLENLTQPKNRHSLNQ
jgi:hypothetical protein